MQGRTTDGRVLAIAHRFTTGFGGVPESLLTLAHALRPAGVTLDVLSRNGFYADAGTLGALPPPAKPQGWREVMARDITPYAALFVAGAWNRQALALALRARLAGQRVVYAPKGNLARAEFRRLRDLKKFPYLFTAEAALLALSSAIILSSRAERRTLQPPCGLFARRMTIIPEPFEPAARLQRSRSPVAPLRIGFMAEIAPRKGLRELVEAFIAWQQSCGHPAELHVAGAPRPGSEHYADTIRRRAAESACASRILFHGPLRGPARDAFHAGIDIFACPSHFESFGLTVLEALSQGADVIATEAIGSLETLRGDDRITICPDPRPAALVTALERATARARRGKGPATPVPGHDGPRPGEPAANAMLGQRFAMTLLPLGQACAAIPEAVT